MGFATILAKKAFIKIFKNLALELTEDVGNVQILIAYKAGVHRYVAYKNFNKVMVKDEDSGVEKEKIMDLDNYMGEGIFMDLTGGTSAIEMTISQAGPKYANELKCAVDDISVFMANVPGKLPKAVLMKSGEKVRSIDIENEFLN